MNASGLQINKVFQGSVLQKTEGSSGLGKEMTMIMEGSKQWGRNQSLGPLVDQALGAGSPGRKPDLGKMASPAKFILEGN